MTTEKILRRPYSRVIIPDESGLFSAELLEFPGCFADGETAEEAYRNLEGVAESWIESAQAQGYPIPEPFALAEPSGTLSLRLPKSLHRRAIAFAQRDAVSLNTFIVAAVGVAVGAEQLAARVSANLAGVIARIEKAQTNSTLFYPGGIESSRATVESLFHLKSFSSQRIEPVVLEGLNVYQNPERVEVGA